MTSLKSELVCKETALLENVILPKGLREKTLPYLRLQSNSPSPHLCPRGTLHPSQSDSQTNASTRLLAPVALRASSCLRPVYPLLQCWGLCAPLLSLFVRSLRFVFFWFAFCGCGLQSAHGMLSLSLSLSLSITVCACSEESGSEILFSLVFLPVISGGEESRV